ncbi:helix-turn-helix transcriptional regulator [Pseudodonghicola flavimaris]|uniref:Helix-turn-helix transcriptional regulator n=1 Tax=Pseudodonghicola flavimaris TaxID=3050036 RepID=A0ABT7EZH9_9RHOB|nr:helix-turn-helix transcriptional regulator [Pseudodonghicola flavimaris]MDK3017756.1 helix-turn-helix transcriptional regulator [Pseudodonghicola flavimaris]
MIKNDLDAIARLPEIYTSVLLGQSWMAALDTVAEIVGARGVILFDVAEGELQFRARRGSSLYDGQQAQARRYVQQFGPFDRQAAAVIERSTPLTPIFDVDVWPDFIAQGRRADVQFLREHFRIFRRFAFNLGSSAESIAAMTLMMDAEMREIPPTTIRRAKLVAPHVAKVVELHRTFAPLQSGTDALAGVIDRLSVGICLVDRSGQLTLANRMAQRILAESGAIWRTEEGRLACRDLQLSAALQAAVLYGAGSAPTEYPARPMREIILPKPDPSANPVYLAISPLEAVAPGADLQADQALILLIDPALCGTARIDPLGLIFGLTRSELDVGELLVSGRSVEAISESRGVKLSTTRSQIKSLFAKTGVSNRYEFMWKALKYMSPLA